MVEQVISVISQSFEMLINFINEIDYLIFNINNLFDDFFELK